MATATVKVLVILLAITAQRVIGTEVCPARTSLTVQASCLPGYILSGVPVCNEDPNCVQSMVSGVADGQLTASSYWCDLHGYYTYPDCLAPKYARLNATGHETGAWAPSTYDKEQWIQVDFTEQRVISAIVVKGRDPAENLQIWVTSFKVSISTDCLDWSDIVVAGNSMIFNGTTGADIEVTRNLPERVVARCVRINPITWNYHIGLRFDVLGCSM